jgi:GntR family transcriptional regulator of arabinose operon
MFGISRQTVRRAVGELEGKNVLERSRGSGTYICAGDVDVKKPRKTVGVISAVVNDYIFPSILKGIEQELSRIGYSMRLICTDNYPMKERSVLQTVILDDDICGLIIVPSKSTSYNPNMDLFEKIVREQLPAIFLEHYYDAGFHCITMDDTAVGRLAAEHLIKAGHKKIAGLFMYDVKCTHLRFKGYIDTLVHASIEYNPQHVLWYTEESFYETLLHSPRQILDKLNECTAMICSNDLYAMKIVKLFNEHNIGFPDDISIVSVDDSDLAELCHVPLTSISHPKELFGIKVAGNLIKLIEDPSFDASFSFEPRLIQRESVKVINT